MSDNNNRQGTDGFALPVVLSAGLLIVAMLSIAIKQSSNNNFNSRIRLLSSLTNSALESTSNEYRALLNDVSNSYYLSYFWLVNGCSANNRATPTNCPKTLGTLFLQQEYKTLLKLIGMMPHSVWVLITALAGK